MRDKEVFLRKIYFLNHSKIRENFKNPLEFFEKYNFQKGSFSRQWGAPIGIGKITKEGIPAEYIGALEATRKTLIYGNIPEWLYANDKHGFLKTTDLRMLFCAKTAFVDYEDYQQIFSRNTARFFLRNKCEIFLVKRLQDGGIELVKHSKKK